MIRNDIREKHEEEFKETNEKPLSVCSGRFYVANRKEYIYCKNCTKCHKNKRYHMRLEDVPEVRFKHAESFRRCKLYEQVINDDFVRTISIFNALYVNDLACTSIMELFDDMKHKDKESQKIYKALFKRMKLYQNFIFNVIKKNGSVEDFADFNELMDGEALPIVNSIKEMVEEELSNNKVEDTEYLSKVEMARTMVEYSIFSLKTRVQEGRRYGVDLTFLYKYELIEIKRVMTDFSNWSLRKVENVDLSQDRFVLKMHELGKTLTNYKKLTEFIDRTIDKKYFEN